MHKIFFDTETTGLRHEQGDRLVEIAAVEFDEKGVFTGRMFHRLVNPERNVPPEAVAIHGHTYEMLRHHPRWAEINDEFCEFIRGCELYGHNSDFDTGFINMEMAKCESKEKFFDLIYNVKDTRSEFRQRDPATTKQQLAADPSLKPGPENFKLDTFIARYGVQMEDLRKYGIDAKDRSFHGALLDSFLLAETYFRVLENAPVKIYNYDVLPDRSPIKRLGPDPRRPLVVSHVSEAELAQHRAYLDRLGQANKAEPIGLAALFAATAPLADPPAPARPASRPSMR